MAKKSPVSINDNGVEVLEPQIKPESEPQQPMSLVLTKLSEDTSPMAAVDRREFQRLIKSRVDTLLNAFKNDLDGTETKITENIRRDRGLILTKDQLNELIESLDTQIEEIISKHVASEKEKVEIEISDIEDEYDSKQKDMKQRHRDEWQKLLEERKEAITKHRTKLKNAEDRIALEYAKDLAEKRIEYQQQRNHSAAAEIEIKVEVMKRVALMKNQRSHLEHAVRDAGNRAQEQLIVAMTRGEASKLIYLIPTVGEALVLCSSAEGLYSLLRRMDPTMPAMPILPAPSKVVLDEEENNDEDEDEEDDEGDIEHDEIYDDEETPSWRRR
jgi:septum formation topological specificity factor MinE